jgi:hypothetical protein
LADIQLLMTDLFDKLFGTNDDASWSIQVDFGEDADVFVGIRHRFEGVFIVAR